jgi:hypothetical protein
MKTWIAIVAVALTTLSATDLNAAPKQGGGQGTTTPANTDGPVRQCREHTSYAACKQCDEGRGYAPAQYNASNQCGGKPGAPRR